MLCDSSMWVDHGTRTTRQAVGRHNAARIAAMDARSYRSNGGSCVYKRDPALSGANR